MTQEHLTFRWPLTWEGASRRHEDRAEPSLSMHALVAVASHQDVSGAMWSESAPHGLSSRLHRPDGVPLATP